MRALSIRQPWAALIVLGIKDIENDHGARDFADGYSYMRRWRDLGVR